MGLWPKTSSKRLVPVAKLSMEFFIELCFWKRSQPFPLQLRGEGAKDLANGLISTLAMAIDLMVEGRGHMEADV